MIFWDLLHRLLKTFWQTSDMVCRVAGCQRRTADLFSKLWWHVDVHSLTIPQKFRGFDGSDILFQRNYGKLKTHCWIRALHFKSIPWKLYEKLRLGGRKRRRDQASREVGPRVDWWRPRGARFCCKLQVRPDEVVKRNHRWAYISILATFGLTSDINYRAPWKLKRPNWNFKRSHEMLTCSYVFAKIREGSNY